MMKIKKLKKEEYKRKKFTARYQTHGYYGIQSSLNVFEIQYQSFEKVVNKSFEDELFED